MVGVLLAREPVATEIVNDLNGRVINWWRAVRDHPEEFGRLVELTPRSRDEYQWADAAVDDPEETPLRRALAFHILVSQSMHTGDSKASAGRWRRNFQPSNRNPQHSTADFLLLADRLRKVFLDNLDALTLLERTADMDWVVIYADPPYPSAFTHAYPHDTLNYALLGELLLAQKGRWR